MNGGLDGFPPVVGCLNGGFHYFGLILEDGCGSLVVGCMNGEGENDKICWERWSDEIKKNVWGEREKVELKE